jgi:hypothetical protein
LIGEGRQLPRLKAAIALVQGFDTKNGASEGQLELDDLDITRSTRD